jgi:hypothetical protein
VPGRCYLAVKVATVDTHLERTVLMNIVDVIAAR